MSLYIENENENVKVTNKKNNEVVVFCNPRNRTNGRQSFEIESQILCNLLALSHVSYTIKLEAQTYTYNGSCRYRLEFFIDSKQPKDAQLVLFDNEEDDYLSNYELDVWVVSGDLEKVFGG